MIWNKLTNLLYGEGRHLLVLSGSSRRISGHEIRFGGRTSARVFFVIFAFPQCYLSEVE